MTNSYYFSIVTCTPHPVRGERINLGIVVVSEDGTLADFRFKRSYLGQLKAIAPDVHSDSIASFILDFSERFSDFGDSVTEMDSFDGLRQMLVRLSRNTGSQITFTEPQAFIDHRDFEFTFNELFKKFVGPLPPILKEQHGRREIRRQVKYALRQWKVLDTDIVNEPKIIGKHGDSNLDLGVRGDSPSSDLIALAMEPISFRIDSSYEIQRQRDHVAWVRSDTLSLRDAPDICAVLTQPSNSNYELFVNSQKLFRDLGVSVVLIDELQALHSALISSGARVPIEV